MKSQKLYKFLIILTLGLASLERAQAQYNQFFEREIYGIEGKFTVSVHNGYGRGEAYGVFFDNNFRQAIQMQIDSTPDGGTAVIGLGDNMRGAIHNGDNNPTIPVTAKEIAESFLDEKRVKVVVIEMKPGNVDGSLADTQVIGEPEVVYIENSSRKVDLIASASNMKNCKGAYMWSWEGGEEALKTNYELLVRANSLGMGGGEFVLYLDTITTDFRGDEKYDPGYRASEQTLRLLPTLEKSGVDLGRLKILVNEEYIGKYSEFKDPKSVYDRSYRGEETLADLEARKKSGGPMAFMERARRDFVDSRELGTKTRFLERFKTADRRAEAKREAKAARLADPIAARQRYYDALANSNRLLESVIAEQTQLAEAAIDSDAFLASRKDMVMKGEAITMEILQARSYLPSALLELPRLTELKENIRTTLAAEQAKAVERAVERGAGKK